MLEEHWVRGPEFGNFVEAASDEVAGGFGEGVGGEVGWVTVDDGLRRMSVELCEGYANELTESWEKMLS